MTGYELGDWNVIPGTASVAFLITLFRIDLSLHHYNVFLFISLVSVLRIFNYVFPLFCLSTFSLYTFDTRKLKQPLKVHMDHVSAVTAIDYSPTGKEFVSGGYDKSVRIFEHGKVKSNNLILMYYLTIHMINAMSVNKPVKIKE